MRRNRPQGEPDVSVVVPVVERYGDLQQLLILQRGDFLKPDSQRGAVPLLKDIQRELQQSAEGEIVIVLLGGSFGEAAALTLGLERARGETIVTLAAYFQVEPRGLEAAFAALDDGADLAVGRRHPRIDAAFNRLQSNLFHASVRRLTATDFHDISCGFRAMRRRVARELRLYGGMHRFIPVLALNRGFAVREVAVPQRNEDRGTRFYGTGVYLGRLLDILTIFFLVKFTRTPLRFFGLLGAGMFAAGFVVDLLVAAQKMLFSQQMADRPLLLLGVLLMVLGMQTLSLGLLGEIIIFTHSRNVRDYQVAEVLRGHPQGVGSRGRAQEPDGTAAPVIGEIGSPALGGALQAS